MTGKVAFGHGEAPFIFAEQAHGVALSEQIVHVTLLANRPMGDSTGSVVESTAHLRLTIGCAMALRDALNNMILMAMPAEGSRQ